MVGGKTNACHLSRFAFPKGFSISHNPHHWSNEVETVKLIDDIINPYVVQKRSELGLPSTQKALMVWDVFKGQVTNTVKSRLDALNILLVPVLVNMTLFLTP